MNRELLTYALAAALLPAIGVAQEPLSLAAALERARASNPEIKALRERALAATSRAEATRKQQLPRFGVDLSAQRTNNAASVFASRLNASEFGTRDFEIARLNSPEALSHLGSALFVEAPLDIAGRIGLAADAQAAGHRAFSENIREAESALSYQVTEAYFGAVLARTALAATLKAVEAARAREEVTQARFDEGLALPSDVLRVRARKRAREADLASQRAELAVAEAMLARLMGGAAVDGFALTDAAVPHAPTEPLDAWRARADTSRPVLRAAAEQQTAATLTRQLEEKSRWPELAAQARLMDDRISFSAGGQSWAVGAMLRWNIFDATRDKRRSAALSDERASLEDSRAAIDRVRFEVDAAFRRLVAAHERLEAARGGAAEGREALRVVQERRTQGLATLTDELETEAAAFAAELEEINAARAAVLAEAALERAAGHMSGSPIQ